MEKNCFASAQFFSMLQATVKQEVVVKAEAEDSKVNHPWTGVKEEGLGLGSSESDSLVTKPSPGGNASKSSDPKETVSAISGLTSGGCSGNDDFVADYGVDEVPRLSRGDRRRSSGHWDAWDPPTRQYSQSQQQKRKDAAKEHQKRKKAAKALAKTQVASVVGLIVLLALLEVGSASAVQDALNVLGSGDWMWWSSTFLGDWFRKMSWEVGFLSVVPLVTGVLQSGFTVVGLVATFFFAYLVIGRILEHRRQSWVETTLEVHSTILREIQRSLDKVGIHVEMLWKLFSPSGFPCTTTSESASPEVELVPKEVQSLLDSARQGREEHTLPMLAQDAADSVDVLKGRALQDEVEHVKTTLAKTIEARKSMAGMVSHMGGTAARFHYSEQRLRARLSELAGEVSDPNVTQRPTSEDSVVVGSVRAQQSQQSSPSTPQSPAVSHSLPNRYITPIGSADMQIAGVLAIPREDAVQGNCEIWGREGELRCRCVSCFVKYCASCTQHAGHEALFSVHAPPGRPEGRVLSPRENAARFGTSESDSPGPDRARSPLSVPTVVVAASQQNAGLSTSLHAICESAAVVATSPGIYNDSHASVLSGGQAVSRRHLEGAAPVVDYCCACDQQVRTHWSCRRCGHRMCPTCRKEARDSGMPGDLCLCHYDPDARSSAGHVTPSRVGSVVGSCCGREPVREFVEPPLPSTVVPGHADGVKSPSESSSSASSVQSVVESAGSKRSHRQSGRKSDRNLARVLEKLCQRDGDMSAVLSKLASGQSSSFPSHAMRGQVRIDPPKGCVADLKKLDEWFAEFHRIVRHLALGREPPADELCTMLVNAWGKDNIVGVALRLVQRTHEYIAHEEAGRYKSCFDLLVARVRKHEVPLVAAKRDAKKVWQTLKMEPNEMPEDFHVRWQAALLDLERFARVPSENDQRDKYLDCLIPECGLYLQHHRKPESMSVDELMCEVFEWYARELSFSHQDGGMRMRPVWDNDRRMMSTPLSPVADNAGKPGLRECKTCGGHGHGPFACPNLVAERDRDWCKRFGEGKRQCKDCQGTGHHAQHHRPVAVQREVAQTSAEEANTASAGLTPKRRKEQQRMAKETEESAETQRASSAQSSPKRQPHSSPNDCRRWVSTGKCSFGDKCIFQHRPEKQGRVQRPVAEEVSAQVAGDTDLLVTTGRRTFFKNEWSDSEFEFDESPCVTRVARCVDQTACTLVGGLCVDDCVPDGETCEFVSCVGDSLGGSSVASSELDSPVTKLSQPCEGCVSVDHISCHCFDAAGCDETPLLESSSSDESVCIQLPGRFDEISRASVESVQLVDFDKLPLPRVDRPPRGYHYFSILPCANLLDVKLHVVWDGGAEGTTLSVAAASRILRAQALLPESQRTALVDLGRQPVQRFNGFAGEDDQAVMVDVNGYLRLSTDDSQLLPEVRVRIAPKQVDDMLIAAPDLDMLGWAPHPEYFTIAAAGLAIPRDSHVDARVRVARELDDRGVSLLRVSESVSLKAFEQKLVEVDREGRIDGDTRWLSPSQALKAAGVDVPEGPVSSCGDKQCVWMKNRTAHCISLQPGRPVGLERDLSDDQFQLMHALEEAHAD